MALYQMKSESELRDYAKLKTGSRNDFPSPGVNPSMLRACGTTFSLDAKEFGQLTPDGDLSFEITAALGVGSHWWASWMFKRIDLSCPHCGQQLESETPKQPFPCPHCAALIQVCHSCGNPQADPLLEIVSMTGKTYAFCQTCFDRKTDTCQDCGAAYLRSEELHYGHSICPECAEAYSRCERCGSLVTEDDLCEFEDDDGDCGVYCQSCYEIKVQEQSIHDYYYKPDPEFLPHEDSSTIYYGIELEVEGDCEADLCANAHDSAQELGYAYCKHDGSLDNGFEIVTHPATYQYHHDHKSTWESVAKTLVHNGFTSHEAGTCGLHVHFSREPFGEENAAKLLYLMEKYWDKFVKFSRRTESQLNSWAARYMCDEEMPAADPRSVKSKADHLCGRYFSVNLTNSATIEIRIFRGTLNMDTFFATLQLVHLLVSKVQEMSAHDVQTVTWDALVESDYAELNAYLAQRRLKSSAATPHTTDEA